MTPAPVAPSGSAAPPAHPAPPARSATSAAAPTLRSKGDALIDASLESAQVMDRNGYAYLIHPLTDGVPRTDTPLLAAWVDWAKRQPELEGATVLLAPEAMGLPLVAGLSLATGIPYGIIRKRKYGLPGEEVAFCETGYGEACLHINGVGPADRVVLVDDVLSTGRTMDSLLNTLASMKVTVQGVLLFLNKGVRRRDLEQRHDVPIKAMRTVSIVLGKVKIVHEAA